MLGEPHPLRMELQPHPISRPPHETSERFPNFITGQIRSHVSHIKPACRGRKSSLLDTSARVQEIEHQEIFDAVKPSLMHWMRIMSKLTVKEDNAVSHRALTTYTHTGKAVAIRKPPPKSAAKHPEVPRSKPIPDLLHIPLPTFGISEALRCRLRNLIKWNLKHRCDTGSKAVPAHSDVTLNYRFHFSLSIPQRLE